MGDNKKNITRSDILDRLVRKFEDREKKGVVKYNTTMDRGDLTTLEWMTHLEEEMMDALLYIGAAKREIQILEEDNAILEQEILDLEAELVRYDPPHRIPGAEFRSPCTMHDEVSEELIMGSIKADLAEIEREKRMNIIGQNGNTGEHYDTTGSVYVAVDNTGVSEWDNTNISSTSNISTRTVYPGDITITENTFKDDKESK